METFAEHYESMRRAILKFMPGADMPTIDRAVRYAQEQHKNQKRKDGSPYIIHPLAVAEIVAEMGLDTDSILAALLHDCIEDTSTTHAEVTEMFGSAVAEIVEGVTKLTRLDFSTKEEQQMENLRKMFMAMSKDIRVILIKIADRLHNTRTMQYQTPAKQILKCTENMDIYAPLAHRLGLQKIKWELEDTSFYYLHPKEFHEIEDTLHSREQKDLAFMENIRNIIAGRLKSVGIHSVISSRVKHPYSIYRKMVDQHKTIDELFDIYAFRIIVDNMPTCYDVLGHIHDLFKLVPGRFKDYISTPKPNNYQSLHTTVIGSDGIPFEVQIRTWQMHQVAEYGVAAHWKYKQGGAGAGQEQDFEWVRKLLENQQDTDAEDYVRSLKVDMFNDEVFVFTPKGKVINLPVDSTPIDFAYAIHSGVGNTMIGAKINHRMAAMDSKLHNGDIVEILTSPSSKGPNRTWLSICKSNQARTKIKQWLKRELRDENITQGRSMLRDELQHNNFSPKLLNEHSLIPVILQKTKFDSMDDLYASIGFGGYKTTRALSQIREELTKFTKTQAALKEACTCEPGSLDEEIQLSGLKTRPDSEAVRNNRHAIHGVLVDGIDTCMIKFARCCTPVPGDEIVGFITKGYGISIHRRDCPNAKGCEDPKQADRWTKVTWANEEHQPFDTSLELDCDTRSGLYMDVATALAASKVVVKEMNGRDQNNGHSYFTLTFSVTDADELQKVQRKLLGIPGVLSMTRGHN